MDYKLSIFVKRLNSGFINDFKLGCPDRDIDLSVSNLIPSVVIKLVLMKKRVLRIHLTKTSSCICTKFVLSFLGSCPRM